MLREVFKQKEYYGSFDGFSTYIYGFFSIRVIYRQVKGKFMFP